MDKTGLKPHRGRGSGKSGGGGRGRGGNSGTSRFGTRQSKALSEAKRIRKLSSNTDRYGDGPPGCDFLERESDARNDPDGEWESLLNRIQSSGHSDKGTNCFVFADEFVDWARMEIGMEQSAAWVGDIRYEKVCN